MRKKHLKYELAELNAKNADLILHRERLKIEKIELERNLHEAWRALDAAQSKLAKLTGPSRPNRKKLTEREVKDIRQAYRGGMSQKDLADNYGVNPATISRTVRHIYH